MKEKGRPSNSGIVKELKYFTRQDVPASQLRLLIDLVVRRDYKTHRPTWANLSTIAKGLAMPYRTIKDASAKLLEKGYAIGAWYKRGNGRRRYYREPVTPHRNPWLFNKTIQIDNRCLKGEQPTLECTPIRVEARPGKVAVLANWPESGAAYTDGKRPDILPIEVELTDALPFRQEVGFYASQPHYQERHQERYGQKEGQETARGGATSCPGWGKGLPPIDTTSVSNPRSNADNLEEVASETP